MKQIYKYHKYYFTLTLAMLVSFASYSYATSYTWSGASSGNWSGTSNWTPTGAPTSGDTADLSTLTSGLTVTYDSGASGNIGTLTFYSTTSGTKTFSISKSLTIDTALTQYATSGISTITLNDSSDLTIASGATYTIGKADATPLGGTYISLGSGYSGNGLIMYGSMVVTTAISSNVWIPTIAAKTTFNTGSTLTLTANGTGGGNRVYFTNDFYTNGTVTITSNGTGTGSNGLYLLGSNISISSGTTFTGFTGTNTGGVVFGIGTSGNSQNIDLGTLFVFTLRQLSSGADASHLATGTHNISSSAVSGSVNNAIYKIYQFTSVNNTVDTLKLASDLNWAYNSSVSTTPFAYSFNNTAQNVTFNTDLNGYTYDMTTSVGSSTAAYAPTGTNPTYSQIINIINSGASSIASNDGIFRAAYFTLSGADVGIGSGVILNATRYNVTNDLGRQASGTTTIDANSTFYYTGLTDDGYSYLTSNRSVGKIVVGSGSGGSTLKLSSTITANGGLTVNNASVFDLNGNSFAFGVNGTAGASLFTGGTSASIKNTSSTAAAITFTSATTASKISPGGDDTVGGLTLNGSSGRITLNLANSITYIDIASSGSNDLIVLNGATTVNYSGGTIYLNFLTTNFTSGTIDVFDISGTYLTDGIAPTITSNMEGTFAFDTATGDITFTLIPEPRVWIMLLLATLPCATALLLKRKVLA